MGSGANIGGPEAMFILVIVLIVFGAGRLPEVFGQKFCPSCGTAV
ncbi:MAG TPA: twin-arginine translocase TatA/TatE family subunit [Vicinamibacterales bacterium]|nr:twin-arginine translocase TatA/TatE family subunit [Vicinamibacterales bacterium]